MLTPQTVWIVSDAAYSRDGEKEVPVHVTIKAYMLLYRLRRQGRVILHKALDIVPDIVTSQQLQNMLQRSRVASLQRDQARKRIVHLVNVGLVGIPCRVVAQHWGDVLNQVMQCVRE
jgi:beta-lactamase class A